MPPVPRTPTLSLSPIPGQKRRVLRLNSNEKQQLQIQKQLLGGRQPPPLWLGVTMSVLLLMLATTFFSTTKEMELTVSMERDQALKAMITKNTNHSTSTSPVALPDATTTAVSTTTSSIMDNLPEHLQFHKMTTPVLAKFHSDIVVTMIAFGNATKTKFVERLVWSLKTNGDWNGNIVVLTDNATHYRQSLQSHAIVVQATEEDLHPTFASNHSEIDFTHECMRMKRFKTLLFEYLQRDLPNIYNEITHVLYLDIDIVVARPLAVFFQDYKENMATLEFIHKHGTEKKKKKKSPDDFNNDPMPPYMHMFTDCDICAKNITNGGFMMLSKESSQKCLEAWRHQFDYGEKRHGKTDQSLLRAVADAGQCQIHVLPSYHRIYPTKREMNTQQTATFVHNTNTFGSKRIPQEVQNRYFQRILNTTLFSEVEHF